MQAGGGQEKPARADGLHSGRGDERADDRADPADQQQAGRGLDEVLGGMVQGVGNDHRVEGQGGRVEKGSQQQQRRL